MRNPNDEEIMIETDVVGGFKSGFKTGKWTGKAL